MPRVGFETEIAVFERAKTFHALGRAATVIGELFQLFYIKSVEMGPSKFVLQKWIFSVSKAVATRLRFCGVYCMRTHKWIILKHCCAKCVRFPWPLILPHDAVDSFWGSNPIVPTQCTICGWILHQALLEASSHAVRHILARCWPWDSRLKLTSCVATLACVQPCTIQGSVDFLTIPW
jgi:hypothetical protein